MDSAKRKIREIVEKYITDFPQEFTNFTVGMKMVRASLKDEKFGQLEGTNYSRALYELPETLHNLFIMGLEEEEMVWLKAGGHDRKEGGLWFAKTFEAFRIPKEV